MFLLAIALLDVSQKILKLLRCHQAVAIVEYEVGFESNKVITIASLRDLNLSYSAIHVVGQLR